MSLLPRASSDLLLTHLALARTCLNLFYLLLWLLLLSGYQVGDMLAHSIYASPQSAARRAELQAQQLGQGWCWALVQLYNCGVTPGTPSRQNRAHQQQTESIMRVPKPSSRTRASAWLPVTASLVIKNADSVHLGLLRLLGLLKCKS